MKNILIVLFLIFTLGACSKKAENIELKYTFENIDNLLHETSPSHAKDDEAIKFSDYGPGAIRIESKALVYKNLIFYAIAFKNTEEANNEALRLNQYYARNWLFDRVEGEPLLEDYLIERLKASNPKRQIQRVPKKPTAEHGEGHEAASPHGSGHGE